MQDVNLEVTTGIVLGLVQCYVLWRTGVLVEWVVKILDVLGYELA